MSEHDKIEYSRDLTQQIPTTGIPICGRNSNRRWMAFTNEGPNFIDIIWIGNDGSSIQGRIRLQSGQAVTFDKNMPWYGSLSAAADTATTTLAGVEVYEQ